MVTIRLTEDEHERLKARAREAGVSVEAYLRAAAEGKTYQRVDIEAALVAHLRTDPTVEALVEDRVYPATVPEPEPETPTFKRVPLYVEQLKRARGGK